jgi:hypothetical protein
LKVDSGFLASPIFFPRLPLKKYDHTKVIVADIKAMYTNLDNLDLDDTSSNCTFPYLNYEYEVYISLEKSSVLGNKLCAVWYKELFLSMKKIFLRLTITLEIRPLLSFYKKSERLVLMIFYAVELARDIFLSKSTTTRSGRMSILREVNSLKDVVLRTWRSAFKFFMGLTSNIINRTLSVCNYLSQSRNYNFI